MKKIIISAAVILIAIVAFKVSVKAEAQEWPMTGWLWSSNIGWVSVNSSDSGSAFPYKVTINSESGAMNGYAWSPSIGWIKFGGLTGHNNAVVDLSTGGVTGFIRACLGAKDGDCANVGNNVAAGGWDGWIELSGNRHQTLNTVSVMPTPSGTPDPNNLFGTSTLGVVLNPLTGYFSGYAWGGDVVGWLAFNTSFSRSKCAQCVPGTPPLLATCSSPSNPAVINAGQSLTYTANPLNGTAPYTYTWDPGTTYGSLSGQTKTVVITYSALSPTDTYQPKVKVRDSTMKVVDAQCIPAAGVIGISNPTQVQLWFDKLSGTTPPADLTQASVPTLRAKVGEDVKVNYGWVLPEGASCAGFVISSPAGWNPGDWSGQLVLESGTYTFLKPPRGTYTTKIRCSVTVGSAGMVANAGGALAGSVPYESNKITFIITGNSAIQEL